MSAPTDQTAAWCGARCGGRYGGATAGDAEHRLGSGHDRRARQMCAGYPGA